MRRDALQLLKEAGERWVGSTGLRLMQPPRTGVNELNLLPNIRTAHPPGLPLPDHVHGLVSLDRSPHRAKALLHGSSLARTIPIDKILISRCDMTLVARGRSSD